MPQLDDLIQGDPMLMRICLYGPPKSKKTWWAGKAAESGYRVLLLDSDDGYHVLKNIDPAAHGRINVVNIVDGFNNAYASVFMAKFLKGEKFNWDWKNKRFITGILTDTVQHIDANALTPNDVVVIDSWTAVARSLAFQYAIENNLDLSDPKLTDFGRDGYRWTGAIATWMIKQLHALPCHVIVIGHATNYEKRKEVTGFGGKKESVVEWSRMQMQSTSGPHGLTLSSNFSDILYFEPHGKTGVVKINTYVEAGRDGGGRCVPPGIYEWEKLQFADVVAMAQNAEATPPPPIVSDPTSVNKPKIVFGKK